ncbi:MAG: cupin domain-containing protein [Deltaproteobacteria bacterium]|nr:cupin domain-containing protein [Deltaproteobacteria bacterium]
MKRVITGETVEQEAAAGRRRIAAPPASTVVTPSAWARARELGVTLDHTNAKPTTKTRSKTTTTTTAAAAAPDAGSAERVVDPSGLVVVRGRSVKLGAFTGAGPDKNIGLLDLVTGADGSPMTAGIMSWSREDSFPWSLDYDEVDLVLEGVLQVEIDGRKLEGRAGDVFYIPKGSRIVFGTPTRTRVFYVTYPANWAATTTTTTQPPRPQK